MRMIDDKDEESKEDEWQEMKESVTRRRKDNKNKEKREKKKKKDLTRHFQEAAADDRRRGSFSCNFCILREVCRPVGLPCNDGREALSGEGTLRFRPRTCIGNDGVD